MRFRHEFYHKHTIYPQYRQLLAKALSGQPLSPPETAYVQHFDLMLDAECGMLASLIGSVLFGAMVAQYKRTQRLMPRSAVIAGALISINALVFASLAASLHWLMAPPALEEWSASTAL